jgi:MFS family permease
LVDPLERDTTGRKRPRFFYGWYVVASSVATNTLLSAAYFQGFGALILPMESYFGWNRTVVSVALALRNVETGLVSPFVGFLLVKITPRQVIFWSGVIMGIGLIGLGLINGLAMFFFFFFVASFGASGASHAVTWPVLVARWFRRKRGLAMGLAVMGPIFGSPFLILNTSIEQSMGNNGWRWVFIGYGVLVIVGVGLISLVVRNSPGEHGLYPDGDVPEDAVQEEEARSHARSDDGLALREVLHTKEFGLLVSYMGGLFIVNSAIHGHQIPYLVNDLGFSKTKAAITVTLVFLLSGFGRIGGGFLMDRGDYRIVLFVMAAVMGLSVLYLQIVVPTSVLTAMPFIAMFGVGFGSMIPIRGTLGGLMFGLRSIGPVIGLMQGGAVAAGMIGPLFLGVMFDINGSYREAMWGLVIVAFAMAPLAFFLSSRTYLRERKAAAGADSRTSSAP